ncbi:hypothetical protein LZP73_21295, partial [Shewanella sp. AS16]
VTGPVLTGNIIIDNKRPMLVPATMMPNAGDNNVLLPNTYNTVMLLGQGLSRDLNLEVISQEGAQLNSYVVS